MYKKISLALALAFTSAPSLASIYCEFPEQPVSTYEYRDVNVCTDIIETYTETNKHCSYGGNVSHEYLWDKPTYHLAPNKYLTAGRTVGENSACPVSVYVQSRVTYSADKTETYYDCDSNNVCSYKTRTVSRIAWVTYSGYISNKSESISSVEKERVIGQECHTENQRVKVWSCMDLR